MHLQSHKAFAKAQGIEQIALVRNGSMASILPQEVQIIDEIPAGRLYRDGYFILEDDRAIRKRRQLSTVGCLSVSLVINSQGKIIGEPLWHEEGLPFDEEGEELDDLIATAINSVFKSVPPKHRKELPKLKEALRRSVRGTIYDAWGKRALVSIHLHQV